MKMALREKAQFGAPTATDTEQHIADTASKEFNCGRYDSCVDYLLQLEINEDTQRQIYHCIAVAQFYDSGLTNYAEFLRHIDGLVDTQSQFFDARAQSVAVILFNRAVVLYHTRRPQAAWKAIVMLLRCLHVFDAPFVQRVGLLAIQLMLNMNQPKRVEEVVELINKRLHLKPDPPPTGSESDEDAEAAAKDTTKSLDQFRWMYRLYKIRARIMNGQHVVVPTELTPEILIMKAHHFYASHDYQMAAKVLTKQSISPLPTILSNGEEYNTTIANNMGLIHFHVRHYGMAVRFFQHALTFDQTATESAGSNATLHAVGASRRPEILYNLGIALLHLKRPKDAFDCFLIPLSIYHNNPRLWLRLAEACIMVHTENSKLEAHTRVASSVIGSGLHRKYVLHPTLPKYTRCSKDDKDPFAAPAPNLEFALLCLRNAMALLEHCEKQLNNSGSADKTRSADITADFTMSPSRGLTQATFAQLKCAILAAYSYVQIHLGEYVLALRQAQELVSLPNLPDAYKMLGNLYCAEALIMLDRCDEARAYLEPEFITELKEDDFIKRASPDWDASSMAAAQAILEYNLTVLLVLRGDIEQARAIVGRTKHAVIITHLKMLTVYIELRSGDIEKCRNLVRIDSPHL